MAEEIVGLKIQVDGSDVGKSVGSLKQQLREAQGEVNALSEKFGATSKEAINAAKRAAELKDAIGDAKALTDAFNPDAKFKALTASLSGVAGGFAAAQGAIALFGVESEEVEKTLLKVQSAMALSQGLQAVGESIDSFKQLGAVIQSTTAFQKINNTVTAITATVMKALGVAAETTSTSFRVLKGAIAATGIGLLVVAVGELVNAFQNYTSAAEKAKKAQDDLNASTKKGAEVALEAELATIELQNQLLVAQAKAKGKSEAEIRKIEEQSARLRIAARKRFQNEIANIDQEAAQKNLLDIKKEETAIVVTKLNAQGAEVTRKKSIREAEALKEKERIDQEKKDFAEAQELIRREKQLGADLVKTEILGISAVGKDALIATQVTAKGVTNAIVVSATEQADAKTKLTEYEKKLEKDKFDAQLGLASQSLSIIGGLVDQNSAAGKAIAVTQAIINTYQGASKAIAQGGIFGPVAAAATIAAGLINVKKIISTKVPSAKGTGNVAESGSPSMSMASAPIAPSAQIQNTVTSLSQQSINQMGSAAGRAYVVESDITNQQEKIVRINRAARLG
jgi:hypothetical protein